MKDGEENLVMGDCSINIDPSADDLVEITLQTAHTVRQFGIEPRVGLLSYSTLGSAKGASVAKVNEAATRLKRMPLDFAVEGEVQFDCAVAPRLYPADRYTKGNLQQSEEYVCCRIPGGTCDQLPAGNLSGKCVYL